MLRGAGGMKCWLNVGGFRKLTFSAVLRMAAGVNYFGFGGA